MTLSVCEALLLKVALQANHSFANGNCIFYPHISSGAKKSGNTRGEGLETALGFVINFKGCFYDRIFQGFESNLAVMAV